MGNFISNLVLFLYTSSKMLFSVLFFFWKVLNFIPYKKWYYNTWTKQNESTKQDPTNTSRSLSAGGTNTDQAVENPLRWWWKQMNQFGRGCTRESFINIPIARPYPGCHHRYLLGFFGRLKHISSAELVQKRSTHTMWVGERTRWTQSQTNHQKLAITIKENTK